MNMLIFFLVYLGGLLSIFSPCVLPVLPFVFARSGKSFSENGLPVLLGMALTFTVLASLATLGGAWLVRVNQYGRYAALLLLLISGFALVIPGLAERLTRPFVQLGSRLQHYAGRGGTIRDSLLIGVAVGFLWAPCGGPILGFVLAGAALSGVNWHTALLLLAFAAGAATSLALVLVGGGKVLNSMKRGLAAEEWVRRLLGVLVIAGVVVIFLGWDTRFLSKLSWFDTSTTEQRLIERLTGNEAGSGTRLDTEIPPLRGATRWLNSPPLSRAMLKGKVVLIDFWTYSCINCLRTLPYIEAWDRRYRNQGLVIIGVHTPEFAFEKEPRNVEQAVRDLGIEYPVAMDNDYAIWNAFDNAVWPAHYLFDALGKLRERHFGEGGYAETEIMIQRLLAEAHPGSAASEQALVRDQGRGALAAPSDMETSPETYVGYDREENFSSPESIGKNRVVFYTTPASLSADQWALSGWWLVAPEYAEAAKPGGAIVYRFRGRDLHLVLASALRKPVRFRVSIDGHPPGDDHGADTDAMGNGLIREQRLYQLIRQRGAVRERTFRIEFIDPGARAFAFTFG